MHRSRSLGEVVQLYEHSLSPLLRFVVEIAPSHGIRQVAEELRNTHAHLYWHYHETEYSNDHITRAFDHLLRAVTDCYKNACDYLLGFLPPSPKLPALIARNRAEEILREVWHKPASVTCAEGFVLWREALESIHLGLRAVYEEVPEGICELLGSLGETHLELCREVHNDLLAELLTCYGELLHLEHRFRIDSRGRLNDHSRRHILLFRSLMRCAVGFSPGFDQDYRDQVQSACDLYRSSLVAARDELIGRTLLWLSPPVLDHADFERLRLERSELPTDIEALDSFHASLIAVLETKSDTRMKGDRRWPGEELIPYGEFFDVVREHLGARESNQRGGLEEADVRALYEDFCALVTAHGPSIPPMAILSRILGDYSGAAMPEDVGALDEERARMMQLTYSLRAAREECDHMSKQAEEYRLLYHDLLERNDLSVAREHRLVRATRGLVTWFADIKGSSKDGRDLSGILTRLAEDVFDLAGGSNVMSTPLVYVNTWGDCVMATFDDPDAAATAALELLKRARTEDIALRIGGSCNGIRGGINRLIGVDVYGCGVIEAARIEPLAEPGELLISEGFWDALQKRGPFEATEVQRKLKKPLRGMSAGTPVSLYSVSAVS